ncbi:hypothetical protein [Nonomuraea endophytica]|uniref:Uncharacterized protein n=1 Tax=Nonomuraea endophytica TaxID=714136 RepID=A0A7W8EHU5_9ACTN|nr:hypothetical protein [Nonomuraea endophytica]MBB5081325.1 hypothetical protein [Nonomuraea endophytica]
MSRYTIANEPGASAGRTTEVGWDAPLSTYFLSAFEPGDGADGDDTEVFWYGCTPAEVPTVEALDVLLAKHNLVVTAPIAYALVQDREREGHRFSTRPAAALIADLVRPIVDDAQQARIDAELARRPS